MSTIYILENVFKKEDDMPFKSKAQFRKFLQLADEGKISKKELHEWIRKTDDIAHLPEKIRKKPMKKK